MRQKVHQSGRDRHFWLVDYKKFQHFFSFEDQIFSSFPYGTFTLSVTKFLFLEGGPPFFFPLNVECLFVKKDMVLSYGAFTLFRRFFLFCCYFIIKISYKKIR
jgi:hypothetical protein